MITDENLTIDVTNMANMVDMEDGHHSRRVNISMLQSETIDRDTYMINLNMTPPLIYLQGREVRQSRDVYVYQITFPEPNYEIKEEEDGVHIMDIKRYQTYLAIHNCNEWEYYYVGVMPELNEQFVAQMVSK